MDWTGIPREGTGIEADGIGSPGDFDWLKSGDSDRGSMATWDTEANRHRTSLPSFTLGYPTDNTPTPLGSRTPVCINPVYDDEVETPRRGNSSRRRSRSTCSALQIAQPRANPSENLFQRVRDLSEQHEADRVVRREGGDLACPTWNRKRPFLTGSHLWEDGSEAFYLSTDEDLQRPAKQSKGSSSSSLGRELVVASQSVPESPWVQEVAILDDLLTGFMGMNGKYINFEFPWNASGSKEVVCTLQPGLDPGLYAYVSQLLPICEHVVILQQFVETRSMRECGLVCHAVAAAVREVLDDWLLMIIQLESLLFTGRLKMQTLWHYINPPSVVLRLLSNMALEAVSTHAMGRSLLNLIHCRLRAHTGNRTAENVLRKLLESACKPYFEMLEKWLTNGELDDPYGEFLIQENTQVKLTSTTSDQQSAYWRYRYTIRICQEPGTQASIPYFLEEHEALILTTGKYLNAIRECGKPVKSLVGDDNQITFDAQNGFVQQFHKVHEVASMAFLEFFMKDLNLVQWLRGIKHFFLLDQGDFIGNLLDIADEEFSKQPNDVSHTRMQSLLELAVRTSSIPMDTDSAPLALGFDSRTLLEMARSVFQKKKRDSTETQTQRRTDEEKKQIMSQARELKGFQVFCLAYRVDWPMTLVVAPKNMQQYQLLFRHMFLIRKMERDLGKVWQTLQTLRRLHAHRLMDTTTKRVSLLCHKMMHAFQQYIHYMAADTIGPLWGTLESELGAARNVDSVIKAHHKFISKVLRHSMLCKAKVVHLFEKMEEHSMRFTRVVMDAISSEEVHGPAHGPRSATDRWQKASKNVIELEMALSSDEFLHEIRAIGMLFTHNVIELIRHLTEVYNYSTSDRRGTAAVCMETGEEIAKLHELIQRLSPCS